MVDNAGEIDSLWIAGKHHVGVTTGASAPEILVQDVIALLTQSEAGQGIHLKGAAENVGFPLPKGLA